MGRNDVWCTMYGVILGKILFNSFLSDLFHFLKGTDLANYAADTTPYSAAETQECVTEKLNDSSTSLFKWFSRN